MKKQPPSPKPVTVKELASMGGKARAKKLGVKRTKEIAQRAAAARWGKKKEPRKKGD